jgi:ATP-dependent RNA helicase DDX52/ROK1
LLFTGDETGKLFALEQLLSGGFEPPALVFLQSKERAGTLFVELQARCPNIPIRLISSELTNEARDKILDKFRTGQVWVLISTEMLGRGLDVANVNLVVNFDLPTSVISYIHRGKLVNLVVKINLSQALLKLNLFSWSYWTSWA